MDNINNYNVISLGHDCLISIIMNEKKIRNTSFPFDWLRTYDLKILNYLKENNNDFLDNLTNNTNPYNFVINNKYKVLHFHDELDNKNFKKTNEKFIRRFDRLKDIIKNKHNIVFLRYYPLDYHSHYCNFFEHPNVKQKENKYINEENLKDIILNEMKIFNNIFKNENIKFIQIIPIKLNLDISETNNIQNYISTNISFNEIINNKLYDKTKVGDIYKKHINNVLKHLKNINFEDIKSICL